MRNLKKRLLYLLYIIMTAGILSLGLFGKDENVHAANYREEAVRIAASQVGYHEKGSPENLDDFTANSGSNNYTKYARDLGCVNGVPWGATFFWWVMTNACVPRDAYPQGTVVQSSWFRDRGLLKMRGEYIPQTGDCILLGNAINYGIIESVSEDSVTIIAGNRGETDAVTRCTLSLDDSYIFGYGIIDYEYNKLPTGLNLGEDFCALIIRQDTWKTIRNDGSDVVLWDEAARADYRWKFERQGDGSYEIRSLYDGKLLTVEGGGTTNGTNVCVQEDIGEGNPHQKWYIIDFWDGYRLVPQNISHFSLDVLYDNDNYNGQSLKIWYKGDGPTQLFAIAQIDYLMLEDIQISDTCQSNMFIGTKQTLEYRMVPENASANMVSWSSSDSSIAEVDCNGVVTAKAKGEVIISCTSTYDTGISDSVRISVKEETSEEPSTEEPSTEEPSTEQPGTEQSSTEQKDTQKETLEKTTEVFPSEQPTETPKKKDVVQKGRRIHDKYCHYDITSVKKKTVKVVAIRNKRSATLKIPSKVKYKGKTYKITAIAGNAFKNNKKLKAVTIGDNIKTIGDKSFYGCTKLKKIVIGKNVTTIGSKAFYGCKRLNRIRIRSVKLKKIGKDAFKKISKKPIVWAPEKKIKTYKKLFKGKF